MGKKDDNYPKWFSLKEKKRRLNGEQSGNSLTFYA